MEGLFELLQESNYKYPGRIFIKSNNRSWTYEQVYSMAINFSENLQKCGIKKGDRVVILCDNSIQYIAALFGVFRLNAVAVPVNPLKMIESILYIIEKCSPKLIVSCDGTIEKLEKIRDKFSTGILNIDKCCVFENPYQIEDIQSEQIESEQIEAYDREDNSMIIFTSGTTAYPKGVTLTSGNLIANTKAIVQYLNLTCEDSILMTLPFTYSYGNSILLTHIFAGASIVVENHQAFPYKVLEEIKEQKVSGFSTVGSYINLMLKCIKSSRNGLGFLENLRYITFAGESTNFEDIDFITANFPNLKVFVMYGQTEAGARLSYLQPELIFKKRGSIGKGLSNVVLKVVDEQGNIIKPGETGEIIAKGPNIMKGYWEDYDSTLEVLKGGWLYTGDFATVDEEGYIYIKGRKSDMIKYMGHRISPIEIENVINSCKYIKESAVIESLHDEVPVIKAYVVCENELNLEEIKRYVYGKLPSFMRPQIFEAVQQLPRTESGKIKRSSLRRDECVV